MTNNKISKATLEREARRVFGFALVVETRDVGFYNVIRIHVVDGPAPITVKELSKAKCREKMLAALRSYAANKK